MGMREKMIGFQEWPIEIKTAVLSFYLTPQSVSHLLGIEDEQDDVAEWKYIHRVWPFINSLPTEMSQILFRETSTPVLSFSNLLINYTDVVAKKFMYKQYNESTQQNKSFEKSEHIVVSDKERSNAFHSAHKWIKAGSKWLLDTFFSRNSRMSDAFFRRIRILDLSHVHSNFLLGFDWKNCCYTKQFESYDAMIQCYDEFLNDQPLITIISKCSKLEVLHLDQALPTKFIVDCLVSHGHVREIPMRNTIGILKSLDGKLMKNHYCIQPILLLVHILEYIHVSCPKLEYIDMTHYCLPEYVTRSCWNMWSKYEDVFNWRIVSYPYGKRQYQYEMEHFGYKRLNMNTRYANLAVVKNDLRRFIGSRCFNYRDATYFDKIDSSALDSKGNNLLLWVFSKPRRSLYNALELIGAFERTGCNVKALNFRNENLLQMITTKHRNLWFEVFERILFKYEFDLNYVTINGDTIFELMIKVMISFIRFESNVTDKSANSPSELRKADQVAHIMFSLSRHGAVVRRETIGLLITRALPTLIDYFINQDPMILPLLEDVRLAHCQLIEKHGESSTECLRQILFSICQGNTELLQAVQQSYSFYSHNKQNQSTCISLLGE